ncbi:MAG TPA: alpha-ketoacid dehydrogenase subunit beta [Anaerolineaceae bacterium]|nr:alpha-ketoacid dehydrogenase subunit beta [Anaerolineaceae bacterium]HQN04567.1 alpha-ketoacid dehydrogenase subunit beta [Anaerolineaceae bacterium]HQP07478.1 alpha-ketoacid dehydrogenase subunit beta [Anaerolineaceae bacterium]
MPEITYLEAIRQAMWQEMKRDDRVFLIGEDIGRYGGAFGVSHGMLDEFGPERIIETPISEPSIVGAAVGAAVVDMRPIVEIMFMDFTLLTLDQIANQAGKMHYMFGGKATVPMVIRMPGGSGTGAAAQHSQSLETLLMHMPGLKVAVPSTPYDAKGLLLSAIRDPNPVCFVEHKLLYKTKGEVPEEQYTIPFGVADIKRQGKDLTIVSSGIMVHKSLAVVNRLAEEGIDVEVVDVRTLKPLDNDTIINSVSKTGKLLVVHEAVETAGWAGEIMAVVSGSRAFDYLDAPMRRLTGKNVPIPYNRQLERAAVPQEEDIEREVRAILKGEY